MNSRIARATKKKILSHQVNKCKKKKGGIEHETMQFIMIDSVTGVCIYDITLSIVVLGVLVEQHAGLSQHTASTLCL